MPHKEAENNFNSGIQGGIYRRAEKIARELKEDGWEDNPDNPSNDMIYRKQCSACGSGIIHHLTKTAFISEGALQEIRERAKAKEECINCKNKK